MGWICNEVCTIHGLRKIFREKIETREGKKIKVQEAYCRVCSLKAGIDRIKKKYGATRVAAPRN